MHGKQPVALPERHSFFTFSTCDLDPLPPSPLRNVSASFHSLQPQHYRDLHTSRCDSKALTAHCQIQMTLTLLRPG
ncbi:hypothetical protein BJX62DRAFT_22491 [Aspergillus germanicus]